MQRFKLVKIMFLTGIVLLSLVAGCKNQDVQSVEAPFELNPDVKIISFVREDKIFVGDMYYDFIEETEVTNHEGEQLSVTDLKPGDLIEIEGGNTIRESFPGQTDAIKVVLQSDTESKAISSSVRHFIEQEKLRPMLGLRLMDVTPDMIILHFDEYAIRSDKSYEVVIKRSNDKYKITEID